MSVMHPEFTNIALSKNNLLSYIMLKAKELLGKSYAFTCEKSPVMAEGKNNLKTSRKKIQVLISLGTYHIFLTNSENFFSQL